MKTTFFLFCVTLSSLAWGQTIGVSVLSGQPQPLHQSSHPEHASQASLASQQSLLGAGAYTSAKGERPLWEVAPPIQQKPLGDTARAVKKERKTAKKATFIREN
jgi:hypothetical protein